RAPVLLAPSMNDLMWEHPPVRANLARLVDLGVHLVSPSAGFLACGREGMGRMAEPQAIAEEAARLLGPKDLAGLRVLVTAGPTREHLDPVRFLSNPSTGKMGYALARAAARRGAEVVLVHGPTSLAAPAGIEAVGVVSAEEMAEAVTKRFAGCDLLVMTAAVADWRPKEAAPEKVKKTEGPRTVEFVRTPDVLGLVVPRKRPDQVVVGFAAETGDIERKAAEKRARKGMDLIVGNDVTQAGAGFGADTNAAVLIDRAERVERVELTSKDRLAEAILDAALKLRTSS
ncbi:MAG: bifunctional phosphopantothenoylcysteine decarboxylase/phosphopantothenate--cysteine ligase CoaBC, partial [Myxococcales bacterium]|nr:bifunctional phosphopantothenoylcysteine decarboxylase/phosphopantothenate--cysteine ligase CoaBC [Myxococcales bacterium]